MVRWQFGTSTLRSNLPAPMSRARALDELALRRGGVAIHSINSINAADPIR